MSIAAGTETTTSLDVLEALDWEPDKECDTFDCGGRAAWYGIPSCGCGKVLAQCDDCKDFYKVSWWRPIICDDCFAKPITIRWEPIKRGSA